MRPFEIVLAVALLITLGSTIIPVSKRPRWLLFLPGLTALIAVAQMVIERYRWQMVPAYVLAGIFFLMSIPLLRRQSAAAPASGRHRRRIVRLAGIALALLLWIVAVAVPTLLPVPRLPEPTGPYAIGTHTFEWVDDSRPETFSSDPNSHRDLIVQVWYPAEEVVGAQPTAYMPEASGSALSQAYGLPQFFLDHLALAPTHSYLDAPVAQAQETYPLLIFSHGYGGLVNQNVTQMEELASYGYIVFSIAHPYESILIIYPDGRLIPMSAAQLQRQSDSLDMNALQAIEDQYKQATDAETSEGLIRQYLALIPIMQSSVGIWTDDTIFVLDEIERLNGGELPGLLSGHLDLDQIGVFGHSFGGAVASEVCLRDMRCMAGVNLDGLQWGDSLDQSISQPFMMIYSDTWFTNRSGETMNDVIYNRGDNQFYRLLVRDTLHFNYTDFSIISPLFRLVGIVGSIDGYRIETIMNHYLVAFFDEHLRGIDSPTLNGPDALYPEADFRAGHP